MPKPHFSKSYSYVGTREIYSQVHPEKAGYPINTPEDVRQWTESTDQEIHFHQIIATFVITEQGELLINGRHSEHVVCASGNPVLSAGEITFLLQGSELEVSEISNQSTGYCPQPESWTSVERVLDKIGIEHPGHFTQAFDFRKCEQCKHTNLIKDQVFECLICGSKLPEEWNFA